MSHLVIYNASIVSPQEVVGPGAILHVENGLIGQLSRGLRNGPLATGGVNAIDAEGGFLMPGIIDLHTDALDAEIIPRPGADIPVAIAFRELERKMSGCGLTTVYHSLHLGYEAAEQNSRSRYSRPQVFEAVHKASTGDTLIRNKIHLRFELSGINAYNTTLELMEKGWVSMLSIMDHTPGQGQITSKWFIEMLMKSGKSRDQAVLEHDARKAKPTIEGAQLDAMVSLAKRLDIPVASHDDDSPEKVDFMQGLGISICEFPINLHTAAHAHKLGMHVIGGASNILRGGSLSGNLSMKEAVLEGSVDSLCSDYYPPAILHAVFKLFYEEGIELSKAVNLAALNPARAAGISDHTGSIEKGKDADLIIVKLVEGIPMVTHTIVGGQLVAGARNRARVKENQLI